MKDKLILIVFILLASSFFVFATDIEKNKFDIITIISDIFKSIVDNFKTEPELTEPSLKETELAETELTETNVEKTSIGIETNGEIKKEIKPVKEKVDYETYEIKFEKEYNMVSISAGTNLPDKKIGELLDVGTWYEYDTLTNKYKQVKTIEAGKAYYVKAEKENTISFEAVIPESITYKLKKGWNLIASPPEPIKVSVFTDKGIEKVYTLEGETYYEISILEPGEGYWIRAEEDINITIDLGTRPRPAEPETCDITDCTVITTPGYHALCNDIYMVGSGSCINIQTNDVELNGQEYNISGDGISDTKGIFVDADNISIHDCVVEYFDQGIHIDWGTSNNLVITNILNSNHRGVFIIGNSNSKINNNLFQDNYDGIVLGDDSIHNIIDNNTILNSEHYAIQYQVGSYNNFTNNQVFGGVIGLRLQETEYNLVEGNSFSNNTGGGIFLYKANNTNISNNIVVNQTGYVSYGGYMLDASSNNTLSNNTAMDLGYISYYLYTDSQYNTILNCKDINGGGFVVDFDSNYNNISNNLIINSTRNGIKTSGSSFNYFYNNTIYNSNAEGLKIKLYGSYAVENNYFINNTICDSGGEDIEYDPGLLLINNNFTENTCNTTSPGTHDDYCDSWCVEEDCIDLYDPDMPMCAPYGDYDPLTSDWAVCSKSPNPSSSQFIRIYKNATICNGCYTNPTITIESDNIIVDFSNSTIGPIWLENREGVIIKNAQIQYHPSGYIHGGLVLDNSNNNNFENLKIKDKVEVGTVDWGVYVIRSSNNTFTDITSYGFNTGIRLVDNNPDTENNNFYEITSCCNEIDISEISSSPYSADDDNSIDCIACGTTALSSYGGTTVTGNIGPSYCSSFDCDMLLDCE